MPSLLLQQFYRHKNGLTQINGTDNEGFSALFVVNTPVVDNSGVAHAVEHMVFRSSKAFPQPETLFQLTSLTDAKINASTHESTTYFHCQSQCADTFNLAINYLLNGLFSPTFTAKDLRCELHDGGEKGVIYQELLGSEQANKQNENKDLNKSEQSEYCYGGVSATIGELSLKGLSNYHQQFYQAENITLVTTNADVAKIAQLIALLPKSQQAKKKGTVLSTLPNKVPRDESSKDDKKYSQGIKNLVNTYELWLKYSHDQKTEILTKVDSKQASLIPIDAHKSHQKNSSLISSLVTLSDHLTQAVMTDESLTIDNNDKIAPVKSVSLPGLFTPLFQQAKKQLSCAEANSSSHHAYIYDESNGLWLHKIKTTERILATIAGYIISAYPQFLATRCLGSCYATQALTIEHSTYLAIYTAFDISSNTRVHDITQCLLALSRDNNFINISLPLAKAKYCRLNHLEQQQLTTITAEQLSSYLLAISNTSTSP